MKPTRIVSLILGIVIVALAAWRIVLHQRISTAKAALEPATYGTVTEFQFMDQGGAGFGSKDLKGKTWVANFIFTRCMGPCPVLTVKMSKLQKEFAQSKNLMFVSFSVDPDFDKPAVLKKYAETYEAPYDQWKFLTGNREAMYDIIRKNFHLAVEQQPHQPPAEIDIMHSLYFALVDENGTIVGYFNSGDADTVEQLRARLKSSVNS